MSEEMENCILKEQLTACIRARCTYWDSDLECCIRVSLKMSKEDRRAWRDRRKAEIAGGVK